MEYIRNVSNMIKTPENLQVVSGCLSQSYILEQDLLDADSICSVVAELSVHG